MKKFFCALMALSMLLMLACPLALAHEVHHMGAWQHLPGDYHWAKCTRCDFVMYERCVYIDCAYEENAFSFCPVCGHYADKEGTLLRCGAFVFDYHNSPEGEAQVIEYSAPFGEESDIVAAYSVIFEYAGYAAPFDGTIAISFPAPEGDFTLLRVDGSDVSEIEYSRDNALIRFNVTDGSGVFLLKKA